MPRAQALAMDVLGELPGCQGFDSPLSVPESAGLLCRFKHSPKLKRLIELMGLVFYI